MSSRYSIMHWGCAELGQAGKTDPTAEFGSVICEICSLLIAGVANPTLTDQTFILFLKKKIAVEIYQILINLIDALSSVDRFDLPPASSLHLTLTSILHLLLCLHLQTLLFSSAPHSPASGLNLRWSEISESHATSLSSTQQHHSLLVLCTCPLHFEPSAASSHISLCPLRFDCPVSKPSNKNQIVRIGPVIGIIQFFRSQKKADTPL